MARKKVNIHIQNQKRKKKSINKVILITFIIFVLFITFLTIINSKKSGNKKTNTNIIPVEAVRVKKGLIRDIVYLTERIQPQTEVKVFSPVPGWLNSLKVDIGSKVQKHQIVATIDRNIVGSEYTKALVKSPISGEVSRIYLDVGATVSPNIPIMSIINYNKLKIYVNVPEKYVYRLKKDNIALIKVEGLNEEFIGKIKKVSKTIDPYTGTFQVKIEIPNKLKKIKPGSFAEIRIILDMKRTLIIPQDSIVNLETEHPFVYTISTNNITKKVYIKTGIIEGDKIEITKGLKENELIVLTGAEVVKDKSKVKVVNEKELEIKSSQSTLKKQKKSIKGKKQ